MLDNKDAVEQQMVDISCLLLTVEAAMNDSPEENDAMAEFQRCVSFGC
jgi:hypothetical protein